MAANREVFDWNGRNDAIEAHDMFRTARSLLFALTLLGLLAMQAAFWVVDCGFVDKGLDYNFERTGCGRLVTAEPAGRFHLATQQTGLITAAEGQDEFIEMATDGPDGELADPPAEGPAVKGPGRAKRPADDAGVTEQEIRNARQLNSTVRWVLKTCYYLLPFVSVIYCLSLLLGMNVAIVGGLGSLAPAIKALFLSLIAVVLIVPWQQTLDAGLPGAMFGADELFENYRHSKNTGGLVPAILYYGRFVGLWGLAVLLMVTAQLSSYRAAKQIRKEQTELERRTLQKAAENIATT